MKLWKISQHANIDWDTYDSAIVAADTEEDARNTLPGNKYKGRSWTEPENVTVELIGEAVNGIHAGVILASFNAG